MLHELRAERRRARQQTGQGSDVVLDFRHVQRAHLRADAGLRRDALPAEDPQLSLRVEDFGGDLGVAAVALFLQNAAGVRRVGFAPDHGTQPNGAAADLPFFHVGAPLFHCLWRNQRRGGQAVRLQKFCHGLFIAEQFRRVA